MEQCLSELINHHNSKQQPVPHFKTGISLEFSFLGRLKLFRNKVDGCKNASPIGIYEYCPP